MTNQIKLINSLSESDLFVETLFDKTREDWREELKSFGLVNTYSPTAFALPRQTNPLVINLADDKYAPMVGYNPRIYVPVHASNDKAFMSVCSVNQFVVQKNFGYCIEGYDFQDHRSAAELGSFLVHFEKLYIVQAMN